MIAFAIVTIIFGNDFLYTKAVLAWQPKPVRLPDTSYNAGILLGGMASFDRNGNGSLNNVADRFIEACELYHTKRIKRLVIAAGSIDPDKPKEADFLYKKALQQGLPAQDVIIENRSRTTYENGLYTKRIVDSLQLKPPFLLITSAMHIPRAIDVFKKAGIDVIAYPTNYTVIDRKFSFTDYFIPKIYVIESWKPFLKEVVGIWGYKVFGKA